MTHIHNELCPRTPIPVYVYQSQGEKAWMRFCWSSKIFCSNWPVQWVLLYGFSSNVCPIFWSENIFISSAKINQIPKGVWALLNLSWNVAFRVWNFLKTKCCFTFVTFLDLNKRKRTWSCFMRDQVLYPWIILVEINVIYSLSLVTYLFKRTLLYTKKFILLTWYWIWV